MKKQTLFIIMILIIGAIGGFSYFFFDEDEAADKQIDTVYTDSKGKVAHNEKNYEASEEGSNGTTNKEKKASPKNKIKNIFKKSVGAFANQDTHFVAVGDSLTQGVGDSTKSGGYVGILDDKINKNDDNIATFENYGHAGDRTDQLLKRMKDPKVSTAIKKADVVLITIGANDIMKILRNNITDLNYKDFEKEQPEYEERLRDVFKQLEKYNPNAEIYLIGFYNPFDQYFGEIPELNKIVDDWNTIGKRVVDEYESYHFIPTKDLFEGTNEDLFFEDNFHPNDTGYEKMATRVFDYLKK